MDEENVRARSAQRTQWMECAQRGDREAYRALLTDIASPLLGFLRRRIAWAAHLSITSGFNGPLGMRRLGLPAYIPPWYPVLRIPFNLTRTGLARLLPGGVDRIARAGYGQQQAFISTLIGPTANAAIGTSADVNHAA